MPIPPEGDGLDDLTYAELRDRASAAGVTPEGRKKVDYIEALRYGRRDMRAED